MPNNDRIAQIQLQKSNADILAMAAQMVAALARQYAPTKRIRESIKISQIEYSGDTQTILVSVSTDDAPEALAFEFGSGIHGELGTTYEIKPKNASALAFFWPKVPPEELYGKSKKFISMTDDGRHMFTHIDHPGVQAKPYMQPALDESIDKFTEELADRSAKIIADVIVL